ncbi:hypothetical protein [Pantoea piersonii]|uniref:hypothetical protein n=1 Tax=Pantoea piersonii TaxID=2364647 RepID=UPI0028A01E96|nr:hypothetical protein [Pantoea piersonii]MDU6441636.1 hypothetical protein [Pantoea sp.]
MHSIFHLERTILIGETSDVEGCVKYEIYRNDEIGLTHAIAYKEFMVAKEDGAEYMYWARIGSTVLRGGRDICNAIERCEQHYKQLSGR